MKTLLSILICLSAVSSAGTAFADDIPPGCQASSAKRAYQSGVAQGKTLVDRAWLAVNRNCDLLERFTDIVTADVESYTLSGSSAYTICRFTGLHDGVYQGVDAVWKTCDGQCCNEGAVIGELSARLYCQLSIIIGGLAAPDQFVRRPVLFCGFAFQMCCDADFFSTSILYRGADLFGVPQECVPYTDGEFFDIWNGTRILQCAYTNSLPPTPKH